MGAVRRVPVCALPHRRTLGVTGTWNKEIRLGIDGKCKYSYKLVGEES